ncbi:hypothetical protein D9757_008765 [Collybiopsis confluens]|uniref:Uncharacterized protein n=1 Tax=Collybiopsis confluens TaxID=2823264 RepID=A0A8H5H519_9AGAR|nr:hypothetical protein D9757_008765 [Collybiopsis confluens]
MIQSPADFHINMLNPESTATRFTGEPAKPPELALTRIKYARIRVVDTGDISPLSGLTKTFDKISISLRYSDCYYGGTGSHLDDGPSRLGSQGGRKAQTILLNDPQHSM